MMDTLQHEHVIKWLAHTAKVISDNHTYLTKLDSNIGDADHGFNMERGFSKVLDRLDEFSLNTDLGVVFKNIGMTLISSVGGASGPLYGTLFLELGKSAIAKNELTLAEFTNCLDAAVAGVKHRGRAKVGDKTMIDVLEPALESMKSSEVANKTFQEAIDEMVTVAEKRMKATIPLIAKKGRASYLGERSIGYQDAGATSSFLLLKCLQEVIVNK